MVGLVIVFAVVFLLVMIAIEITLTWHSLQDDRYAPHAARSDNAE
jgi:hypothetical protein